MKLNHPDLLRGLDEFAATLEAMARDVRAARSVVGSGGDPDIASAHLDSLRHGIARAEHCGAALFNTLQLIAAERDDEVVQ